MINIGFDPPIFLGLILVFEAILLYFLRVVKPEVARDEDIFFTTTCILIIHGWQLNLILLFSQVLIMVSLLIARWKNIRLSGLLANIAK